MGCGGTETDDGGRIERSCKHFHSSHSIFPFFSVCYFSRLLIRVLRFVSPSPVRTYDDILVSPTPDPGLDPNNKRSCGRQKNKTKKRKFFCQTLEILIFQTFLVKTLLQYSYIIYVVLYVAGSLYISTYIIY